MKKVVCKLLICLFGTIYWCQSIFAATPIIKEQFTNSEIRKNYWSFALSGTKHSLKAGDGNEIIGNSMSVSIGTGFINKRLYSYGALDILLGPYELEPQLQLDIDYQGTGLTYWFGYSAQEIDLRNPEGGYGFSMGLKYSDIIGRSIAPNRKQNSDPDSPDNIGLVNDYTMRVTNFSIIPSIFFCWLEDWRPRGNTPELLTTRLEGYILTIGIAVPFISKYQASYTTKEQEEGIGRGEIVNIPHNASGTMDGFSLIVNFAALLGI